MHFFSIRGAKGMQYFFSTAQGDLEQQLDVLEELLMIGPEMAREEIKHLIKKRFLPADKNWLDFFYPSEQKPVFLFIDQRMIGVLPWIYHYSKWDVAARTGPSLLNPFTITNVQFTEDGTLFAKNLKINIALGIIEKSPMSKQPIKLSKIIINQDIENTVYSYPDNDTKLDSEKKGGRGIYQLEVFPDRKLAKLYDKRLNEMLISRLFRKNSRVDSHYFKPVETNLPYYQVWKVHSDRIK